MWLGDSTAGDSIINIGKKVKERLMIDANVSPFCRKFYFFVDNFFLQNCIMSTTCFYRIKNNRKFSHFCGCHKVLTKNLFYIEIQRGLEYQTHLDFEWLKVAGC